MKKTIVLVALLAVAGPALAATLTSAEPAPLFAGSYGAESRGTVVYSDTATITAGYSQPGGTEIGDELDLATALYPSVGPGEHLAIDSVKWSVYNPGASAPLNSVGMLINFYDATVYTAPVLLGSIDFGMFTFTTPLGSGYYTTFSATNLSASYDIPISDYLLTSLTLYFPSHGQNVGQVLANPPTIGSSTNDFWKGPPPGSWLWFGSTGPVANFYWEIDVAAIPEPASLLLVLGGLLLARRR